MPRSGTTVLRDILARMPGFATTTEVTRKAPVCMPLLRALSPFYRGEHRPVEAGSMWDRFVRGDTDVLGAADATPAARAFYTQAARNVLRLYGNPRFLAKCPRNGLRMDFLLEIFPDARFIHLVRDARAVCRSVLEKRGGKTGADGWWDVRPADWRQWVALDPVAAVAHQWDSVVRAVADRGTTLPRAQYREIRYEDFVADPVSSIRQVALFCDTDWPETDIRTHTHSVQSRNDKWGRVFNGEQLGVMAEIAGETMRRFGYNPGATDAASADAGWPAQSRS